MSLQTFFITFRCVLPPSHQGTITLQGLLYPAPFFSTRGNICFLLIGNRILLIQSSHKTQFGILVRTLLTLATRGHPWAFCLPSIIYHFGTPLSQASIILWSLCINQSIIVYALYIWLCNIIINYMT